MELNNNPNKDYEYAGSPKRNHYATMILAIILGILMLGLGYYYNTQFIAHEEGERIIIFDQLYQIYNVFGKWPVLVLFIGPAIGMFYAAYKHYEKHLKLKNMGIF